MNSVAVVLLLLLQRCCLQSRLAGVREFLKFDPLPVHRFHWRGFASGDDAIAAIILCQFLSKNYKGWANKQGHHIFPNIPNI